MLLWENQCPPLVVVWGWTGRTHICPHNTTADLAVTGRERERGAAAKGPTVLFIKALSSPRPATGVWHHTVSPASTTELVRGKKKKEKKSSGWRHGDGTGDLDDNAGIKSTSFMWHWSTEKVIANSPMLDIIQSHVSKWTKACLDLLTLGGGQVYKKGGGRSRGHSFNNWLCSLSSQNQTKKTSPYYTCILSLIITRCYLTILFFKRN